MCKNEISSIMSKGRMNKNEQLEVNIRMQQSEIIQLRKALTLLMDVKKVSPEDMKQLEFMRSIGEI